MVRDETHAGEGLSKGVVLLDRYEILRPLGQGGLATACLVHDRLWNLELALKLVLSASDASLDALRHEFNLLRGLSHPRLAQVHDFGVVSSPLAPLRAFYTADFIDGSTLGELIRAGSWEPICRALCDALEGLRVLHAIGIRHGDFKPANVLVRKDGSGVLIDLSCSQPLLAPASHRVSGTPRFLAPELIAGARPDHRADLFAVGVTLQDIVQSSPWIAPSQVQRLAARLSDKDPSKRPADVDEVLELLGRRPTPCLVVPAAGGRLVGRQAELEAIHAAISRCIQGEPGARLLHVVGPEGIGRTRLLQELKWIAQQRIRAVEANASAPTAIADLLSAALRRSVAGSIQDVISLGESQDAEPTVLVVDDAHLLTERQLDLLRALARSLSPAGRWMLAVSSLPGLALQAESCTRLDLKPLDSDSIAAWCGDALPAHALGQAERITLGVPAALHALMKQLSTGELTADALAHGPELSSGASRIRLAARSLRNEQRRVVGLLALTGRTLAARELGEPSAIDSLLSSGWIERQGAGCKLAGLGTRQSVIEALDPRFVEELHATLAAEAEQRLAAADPQQRPELAAQWVIHLACGAKLERAALGLIEHQGLAAAAPIAWSRAAEEVSLRCSDPQVQLAAARVSLSAGQAQRAMQRLESLLQAEHPAGTLAAIRLELCACHLKAGDASQGASFAQEVLRDCSDPSLRARASALMARSLLQLERYREAVEQATRALEDCSDPAVRADLLETSGLALGFAGEPGAARDRLDQAERILIHEPRRVVRSRGARGLIAYQAGDLVQARSDYGQALELAERHGLVDQVATAALNLGTACHQEGDLAAALSCYERGLRTATALGQSNTRALLLFNLAKLHADIGLLERAEDGASRCEQVSRQAELPTVLAAIEVVRGEIAQAQGHFERAREQMMRAREALARQSSAREQAEVELQLADLALARSDAADAAAWLRACSEPIERTGARDLGARLLLVRARSMLASSRAIEAVALLEKAAAIAREIGQRDLEAELEQELSRAWKSQGSSRLAATHLSRASELWERTAALLPPAMREAFWKHPRRAAASTPAEHPALPSSSRERKLELLLDINKRINSSLRTQDILQRAMDAAIDLTGAERGFVLLARQGQPARRVEVAVARNLDREKLDRSHLKFSRGIAEQVLSTGEPIVTANAQADGRFSSESSVHAMHLQSVACVPVLSPDGVLGALYLDHRFQHGRFSDDDVQLLIAFADQVAIALTNARLHDELQRRNAELETERERIQELAKGQEAELEQLHEQVRVQQPSRTHRFDYSMILGASPSMQKLFSLLDRVIDSSLPVLVQGESGTGKELVARAIHRNGPQRSGPLVSINCAAVPEALLESELFGYERGAFTGADQARQGLVLEASGGVLFLDELGEMPLSMQVKLLRVLQEREVRPLGSRKSTPVDFRLVCATNRRLREEVDRGSFREDLYYRVAAVELTLPALRERAEDIPELAMHFLHRAAQAAHRAVPDLSRSALRKLMAFSWPGNVRQLDNVLTRALVMADQGRISAADIELPRSGADPPDRLGRKSFEQSEKVRVSEALQSHRWNVSKAAIALGIPRPTLYRKLRRWGLIRQGT
ncbi:MAG: sigma 54-interacting transcriptional regulator [Deltaproteobacteria bacterium]|nr:sigma 54-interacting transcriptional regulator [Deltaproteobacteria bacterium]